MNLPFEVTTKRQLLSSISKLFDPLGLLSPILIRAKMTMQDTWATKLGWDDPLTDEIKSNWNNYVHDVGNLNEIIIQRRVTSIEKPSGHILHGFCDASLRAYGACIYLQSTDDNGSISSFLVCSKSRVAPVKSSTITLPRLELCGAIILTRLLTAVKEALKIHITEVHAWTDYCTVLDCR